MAYTKPVIVIDPGHGKTSGTSGAALYKNQPDIGCVNGLEDTIVGEVAGYVRSSLVERGYKVIMMDRNNHAFVRAEYSNSQGADVFVSIHCNAFNGTASGTETFYGASTSLSLANYVHNRLRTATGLTNRGVKLESYWQFRGGSASRSDNQLTVTNIAAACLVELGFIDNPNDLAVVQSKKQAIGVAIANGIVDYIGSIPSWPI